MKPTKIKVILIVIFLTGISGIGWTVYQYSSIHHIGVNSMPVDSDVIIVLGAGVWEHGPSPALKARLDRAIEVYENGYGEVFIVTGGLGDFPPTEAEAMRDYLVGEGVPPEQIFLEPLATNTLENLQNSKVIMEEYGWRSAVIVTDVFHMKRALNIAEDLSIDATGAAAVESVLYTNRGLRQTYMLREVAAMGKYYFESLFR
ncbi:MAG: YdcF family protein [Bacillus sp. (in: Bacteria)]|nr:YdcF family protein [Bacillus sp. (in: firmicutes)]